MARTTWKALERVVARLLGGALVVLKRSAGPGRSTPMLIVLTAHAWQALVSPVPSPASDAEPAGVPQPKPERMT